MNEYIGNMFGVISHNNKSENISVKDAKIKISYPRYIDHHKMVFACLNHTVQNMTRREGVNSAEKLLLCWKDYAGKYDVILRSDKTEIRDYHSISFASMNEEAFKPIAEEIKNFCCLVLSKKERYVTDKLLEIMRGRK